MTKVHHLFPPLAFLMDACLDLFDEDVQREVASPFMTQVKLMKMVVMVMMRRRKSILASESVQCCETVIQTLQNLKKHDKQTRGFINLSPAHKAADIHSLQKDEESLMYIAI